MKRALWIGFSLAVTAFGVAILHYVNGVDINHHRDWARTHGLPEPSDSLFWLGSAVTVVGAFVAGLLTGRRRAQQA